MAKTPATIEAFVGRKVVLDTAGTITYLGTLKEIHPDGFWLEDADFRDQREGHQTKEHYVAEARTIGIRPNRRRVFVFRHVVISISALDDVVID
jgi:hypothetical protein